MPFGGIYSGSNPDRPASFQGPGKQPKQTSLEELGDMEAEALTATLEETQEPSAADPGKGGGSGSGKDSGHGPSGEGGKVGKPAPERKRARNLSEDKRFKLFQRHG
jgi:hypothetical protein